MTDSRDLILSRVVPVAPALVWRAWTEPSLLVQWFTPKPWRTIHCEMDLRPGGRFRTVMRGPEGQEFDGTGCYLVVEPPSRLVWTSAMGPDFRPVATDMPFTADLRLTPEGAGTRYVAVARHADTAGRERHAAMGFETGWGIALDQLVALMQGGDGG